MDFEDAADRLLKDQSKIKNRHKTTLVLSERAKKQAEFAKKQQEQLRLERERKKRIQEYQQQYIHKCQRILKEQSLGPLITTTANDTRVININNNNSGNNNNSNSSRGNLLLTPTSIFGEGDKIALPPSVLETLTSSLSTTDGMGDDDLMGGGGGGNPWTFRIGIPNPKYEFPASPLIQNLQPPHDDVDNDNWMDENSDTDDDDEDNYETAPYMDELGHKYIAYTHCTVVEFTQEEGYVGIPQPIASVLLDPQNRHADLKKVHVPTTRTIDPARVNTKSISENADEKNKNDDMDMDANSTTATVMTTGEQTPGHLAWGAFPIPDLQLEIIMIKLPKGRGCTLTPTREAIRNNFYGLMDVKLVLEQSLLRTRATLSTRDVVSTWHRGCKFDLIVSKVIPSTYQAVTCINTDIEVDIGETQSDTDIEHDVSSTTMPVPKKEKDKGFRLGTGQIMSSTKTSVQSDHASLISTDTSSITLLPEPPVNQTDGVCTIRIRYSGGQGKRRFLVERAQVKDLFAFAASLLNRNERSFRLVTRFPRREISLTERNDTSNGVESGNKKPGEATLAEIGLPPGQELFLVENL